MFVAPIFKTYRKASCFLLACLLFFCDAAHAQKSMADSLNRLLSTAKADSNRVRYLCQLADAVNMYNPDTSVELSQQAIYLARELKYADGESRALGTMANAIIKIGNYPRALELYFQKLQLEEKRQVPRSLVSVLSNIGIVYVMQEEYNKALDYYYRAYAITKQYGVKDMEYYIFLNLGDVYNRLNNPDSSYMYFSKSLALASVMNDTDLIATAKTGLGHSYMKMGNYMQSLASYQQAIAGLKAVNDDEILCEATLGLAGLYQRLNNTDSAAWYAVYSEAIAKKDGFLTHEMEAAAFLTQHYKNKKDIDSAFVYVTRVQVLNDSINSKTRIRESQILSSNEQLRQLEIEENKKIAARERHQQLQLLFIGIFIPGFFLFTLLLSRIKIHPRIVKVLGILSLLISFEYLTLLLHPYVVDLTHHTPVYEILIFVAIAAVLIPAHHRLEHWLIEKLTRKTGGPQQTINLITKRIKIKRPSAR